MNMENFTVLETTKSGTLKFKSTKGLIIYVEEARCPQCHRKKKVLASLGWKILRFWNHEIENGLPLVVKRIREFTT